MLKIRTLGLGLGQKTWIRTLGLVDQWKCKSRARKCWWWRIHRWLLDRDGCPILHIPPSPTYLIQIHLLKQIQDLGLRIHRNPDNFQVQYKYENSPAKGNNSFEIRYFPILSLCPHGFRGSNLSVCTCNHEFIEIHMNINSHICQWELLFFPIFSNEKDTRPSIHIYMCVSTSGDTLCRDNCQLIGMPFFHTRSAGKNNRD